MAFGYGLFLFGLFFGFPLICLGISASINEAKPEENKRKREAFESLRYSGRKEGEFWNYFYKRKKGKLTYIVPEFEERIVKMNKLKKDSN